MTNPKAHPKGLYLLFTVEMWERFSYYGMRSFLIFYLTKSWIEGGLGFNEQVGNLIYGYFIGLMYFTPLIGGWIADRFWGQRKAVFIGSFIMIAGHLIIASQRTNLFLFLGLFLLVIGVGLFKPNISTIVGQLYDKNDKRIDNAFTIFYMGINVGGLLGGIVMGYVCNELNYSYGFLVAAIGLVLGQIIYIVLGNRFLGDKGKFPQKLVERSTLETKKIPLTKEERDRTKAIFIIVFFVIFFFAGFEQAGSSMNLYTEKYINREFFGYLIPVEWFQSLNPLLIVTLAPLFTVFWTYLSKKNKEPNIPVKMAWGMILLGVGFFFMLGAVMERGGENPDISLKSNLAWLLFAYLLHTMGELCLSPLGLSMISKVAPVKLVSMFMGMWFVSISIANIAGGYMASMIPSLGAFTIFGGIALLSIFFGVILLLVNKRIYKLMHLKK